MAKIVVDYLQQKHGEIIDGYDTNNSNLLSYPKTVVSFKDDGNIRNSRQIIAE